MLNFQDMIFKWIRTYRETFKSVFVYLKQVSLIDHESFKKILDALERCIFHRYMEAFPTSFHSIAYLIISNYPVLVFVSSYMVRGISRAPVTPEQD